MAYKHRALIRITKSQYDQLTARQKIERVNTFVKIMERILYGNLTPIGISHNKTELINNLLPDDIKLMNDKEVLELEHILNQID